MKKVLLCILLIFILKPYSMISQNTQLIYFGDPMCSWCYGFGPQLDEVKEAFPNLSFRIVMGGLRPYGKETMAELKDFLEHHWDEIKEKTGKPFKKDILENSDLIYDTEPASRAVVTFRTFLPDQEIDFFHGVQKSFYAQNKDPHSMETYTELAKDFGVDPADFAERWSGTEMEKATLSEFQFSGSMGIRGFPSIVLKIGEQYYMVANGYTEAERVIAHIQQTIEENPE